jgi:hypothetical protein
MRVRISPPSNKFPFINDDSMARTRKQDTGMWVITPPPARRFARRWFSRMTGKV